MSTFAFRAFLPFSLPWLLSISLTSAQSETCLGNESSLSYFSRPVRKEQDGLRFHTCASSGMLLWIINSYPSDHLRVPLCSNNLYARRLLSRSQRFELLLSYRTRLFIPRFNFHFSRLLAKRGRDSSQLRRVIIRPKAGGRFRGAVRDTGRISHALH